MGWFKKLFVSNLPEEPETVAPETEPEPLPEFRAVVTVEESDPVMPEQPVFHGREVVFLVSTPDHRLFVDHTDGIHISGHGTYHGSLLLGDVVLLKGPTGNVLRYVLEKVERDGADFTFEAVEED